MIYMYESYELYEINSEKYIKISEEHCVKYSEILQQYTDESRRPFSTLIYNLSGCPVDKTSFSTLINFNPFILDYLKFYNPEEFI